MESSQIQKILDMRVKGKTYSEIGEAFGFSKTKVVYWLNEDSRNRHIQYQRERQKNMTKEQRKAEYKRKYPYIKQYLKNRYHNDEKFRKKVIESSKRSNKKIQLKNQVLCYLNE